MAKASRDKGKRAENELCAVLMNRGFAVQHTALLQTADDQSAPDITATKHCLTLAVEAKHQARLPPKGVTDALEQVDEALVGTPNVARAVFMRLDRKPGQYVVAMRSEEFFALLDVLGSSNPR